MTDTSMNSLDVLQDIESSGSDTIRLTAEQVNRAVQLSCQGVTPAQQWQTYLNALALAGFEQWLGERASDLSLNQENSSIFQPAYANAIAAVANVQVGTFKLCLLAAGSLTDEVVSVPQAVIDLPEFAAHFYVVLEVLEEQEQVRIQGFMRRDQLTAQLEASAIQPDTDWTYELPSAWFEPDANELLLYMRCLAPGAIALPQPAAQPTESLSQLQADLAPQLPRLRSETSWWQILSWEQAAAILANPELLSWVLGQSEASPSRPAPEPQPAIAQQLAQQAMNVGRWLRDELDQAAQNLSWVLLPTLTPASAMRSAVKEFSAVTQELTRSGLAIPTAARGAYQDLELAGSPVRLHAVTWPILSSQNPPEWTLLIVLGPQPDEMRDTRSFRAVLPEGILLRISDQTQVLVERRLQQGWEDTYLYARVVGTWDEEFLVTLSKNGQTMTLPPFAFHPNSDA